MLCGQDLSIKAPLLRRPPEGIRSLECLERVICLQKNLETWIFLHRGPSKSMFSFVDVPKTFRTRNTCKGSSVLRRRRSDLLTVENWKRLWNAIKAASFNRLSLKVFLSITYLQKGLLLWIILKTVFFPYNTLQYLSFL